MARNPPIATIRTSLSGRSRPRPSGTGIIRLLPGFVHMDVFRQFQPEYIYLRQPVAVSSGNAGKARPLCHVHDKGAPGRKKSAITPHAPTDCLVAY